MLFLFHRIRTLPTSQLPRMLPLTVACRRPMLYCSYHTCRLLLQATCLLVQVSFTLLLLLVVVVLSLVHRMSSLMSHELPCLLLH
jgi:hypothetical protein